MSNLTVGELAGALSANAPFDAAAGWDPVGLQLGDSGEEVEAVGVCHEVTDRVVDAALERSIDTLVTYHPLLFHATRRLVAGPGATGRAHRLIRAGISLIVVHTAFDVADGGTADALAQTLGLERIRGFAPLWGPESSRLVAHTAPGRAGVVLETLVAAGASPTTAVSACRVRSSGHAEVPEGEDAAERIELVVEPSRLDAVVAALARATGTTRPRYDVIEARGNAGFVGRVGELPTPRPLADFATRVGRQLECVPRVAPGEVGIADVVAVLPGSGMSMVSAAAATGASVFVTGDVAHHQARLANECGMAVVDAAHAPTERPGVRRLYAAVAAIVDVAVDLSSIDADPWEAN